MSKPRGGDKHKQSLSEKDVKENVKTGNCALCKKDLYDDPKDFDGEALACDSCMNWVCVVCAGTDQNQYNAITKHELTWYCRPCTESVVKFHSHCSNIIEEQAKLHQEIQEVRELVSSNKTPKATKATEQTITNLATKINKVETDIANMKYDEKFKNIDNFELNVTHRLQMCESSFDTLSTVTLPLTKAEMSQVPERPPMR